jgi:hypothetical protein
MKNHERISIRIKQPGDSVQGTISLISLIPLFAFVGTWNWVFFILFLGVLCLYASAEQIERQGITFNETNTRAVLWRRFLYFHWEKSVQLDKQVRVEVETKSQLKRPYYRVNLSSKPPVVLLESFNEAECISLAEQIGKTIGGSAAIVGD